MKKLFVLGIAIIASSLPSSIAVAQTLSDVPYRFDQQKLQAAADPFHFLRSFVDYFYLVAKTNRSKFKAIDDGWRFSGWCVGDAHPENFGAVILKDGASTFTMNDMDDSGPAPVVLDLVRLMVSSRLYDADTRLDRILEAYRTGLKAQNYTIPDAVAALLKKSGENGTSPDPDDVVGGKLKRNAQMSEVSRVEKRQMNEVLAKANLPLARNFKIIDLLATKKVGGGSGGLLRYEILINNDGVLVPLELKEEVQPAINSVAAGGASTTAERIRSTIQFAMGPGASSFYSVVEFKGKAMLVRPRFSGNIGVSLDKQTRKENADLIRYEAYQLGVIHSRSLGPI